MSDLQHVFAIGTLTMKPLLEDTGIPLAIMGMLVVFLALVLVASFISLLPRMLSVINLSAAAPAAAPVLNTDADEISDELLVVITAAVAAVMDTPHRIVRIRGVDSPVVGWSLEGRMAHHHSHGPRHRGSR